MDCRWPGNSNFFVDNDIESPRAFLDAVSGDHPVFLDDDSAHHGWPIRGPWSLPAWPSVLTPLTPRGVFVRDEQGIPNGVLLRRLPVSCTRLFLLQPRPESGGGGHRVDYCQRFATAWGDARALSGNAGLQERR